MYKFFCRNLKNYLATIPAHATDYRAKLSRNFKGFLDVKTYQSWAYADRRKWEELSNLVWLMGNSLDQYPMFHTFYQDLLCIGYSELKSCKFNVQESEEQLKILYLCVLGQYL